MQRNNIYRINTEFIKEQGFDKLASVYIPSIHKDYDTYTICYVFQRLFGTVCRIDRVNNTTSSPDFQSVFVYYYENNYYNEPRETLVNNRVYPGKYVPVRRTLNDRTKQGQIKATEFWVALPNKTMFEDTTLTLDEISARLDTMRDNLAKIELVDQDELDILAENREYLRELRFAENTHGYPYLDTTVNIHQLAQNIKLMEQRYQEKKTSEEMTLSELQ
jgi:hypothetical protein